MNAKNANNNMCFLPVCVFRGLIAFYGLTRKCELQLVININTLAADFSYIWLAISIRLKSGSRM